MLPLSCFRYPHTDSPSAPPPHLYAPTCDLTHYRCDDAGAPSPHALRTRARWGRSVWNPLAPFLATTLGLPPSGCVVSMRYTHVSSVLASTCARSVLAPSDPGAGFGTTSLRGGSFWMACPHAPRQVGRRYEPVATGGGGKHSTSTPSTHTPFAGEGLSSERVPCISMCLRNKSPQPADLKRGTGGQPQIPDGRRPCHRSEMPQSDHCPIRCVP